MGNTPRFFQELNAEFNFTLDPSCVPETTKCKNFFTPKENGLLQDWASETVFVNPPNGRDIADWVEKAYREAQKNTTVVMLLPARTSTRWFHDWIFGKAELCFIKGRMKFLLNGKEFGSAPFPCMLAIFKAPDIFHGVQ